MKVRTNVDIYLFAGPELTDERLLRLSQKINCTEDLYILAIIGLCIKDETIDAHMRNKSDSITMATYSVLKGWRKSQPDHQVAYRKMCDGLKKAEMESYIYEVLQ